ncbi:hypothetical protein [Marinobacter sp.]|uniref:hypothetical protein n=1 Tax=Marinobacter sp. TaxID=50741 RepID=UPI0019F061A3|nr:hypothetical protein [Marinobacter sp.]MBE0485121.1 hypothetical protein [Marinobacter sp.]
MKNARLRTQPLLALLILFSLTAFGAKAQDTGSEFLSDLHDFRINNYLALDSLYAFSAAGDSEALNRIVESINASNDAMNSIITSTSGALTEQQVESLNQEFDVFKDLMRGNINEVREQGYPDLRLMADLADNAMKLNIIATDLYSVALDNSNAPTDARIESARSAAVVMAQMMARYSARTHSSVAQTFQGSSDEAPLDQQALQFDSLLAQLQTGSANRQLKSAIDDVSSKWQFIRGSYINYNENNVSFVIDRYSKGIIRGLTTTIVLLQNNV